MKKYICSENGSQARFNISPFKPSLTKEGEAFAREQNNAVTEFVRRNLKISPYLVARDRLGNIVIIEKTRSEGEDGCDTINCYMLGKNTEKNVVSLFKVGYLDYHAYGRFFNPSSFRYESSIYITKLAVHEKFQKNGVGTLLLQVLENYGSKKGYDYIRLGALQSYDIRDDIVIPNARLLRTIRQIKQSELKSRIYKVMGGSEIEEFLRKSLFNRNLYFYNHNGYFRQENASPLPSQDPLIKTELGSFSLDLGPEKSLSSVSQASKLYALPEDKDPILSLNISYNMKLFSERNNYYADANFTPLKVEPTRAGVGALKRFISGDADDEFTK